MRGVSSRGRASAFRTFTTAAVLGTGAVVVTLLALAPEGSVWIAYLVAISVVTVLMYGYDKAVAASPATRVPEKVLIGLAIAGGAAAALLSQEVFRHKTNKETFRMINAGVLFAHLAALAAIFWI